MHAPSNYLAQASVLHTSPLRACFSFFTMPASFGQCALEVNKCEHTAESRSTSAGSRESGSQPQPVSEYNSSYLKSKLPEYEYPVPVIVRNTFIETKVGRPVSLDEFFQERRIRSCPVGAPEHDEPGDDVSPEAEPLHRAITTGAQTFMTKLAEATGFWTVPEHYTSFPAEAAFSVPHQTPRVLMLAQALPEPALGSLELPTVGSSGHHVGDCKPCAFFHTKGCSNGTQCPFCHLCPADEKRKRQKDKQAAFREMRRQRRQVRL